VLICNPLLDRLIAKETCAEIICSLHPHELLMAFLRAEQHADPHIAEIFCLPTASIAQTLFNAKRRIIRRRPDPYTATLLHRTPKSPQPPYDTLNLTQAAAKLHVSRQTLSGWCKAGRLPGARRNGNGRGWRIPLAAIEAGPLPVHPPDTLSPSQASRILGVHSNTVLNWCQAGKLPGAHRNRSNGHWRIPIAAIHALQKT
jgi:hypothetical protein